MPNKPEFSEVVYKIIHRLMDLADDTKTNPSTLEAREMIEKYIAEVEKEKNEEDKQPDNEEKEDG